MRQHFLRKKDSSLRVSLKDEQAADRLAERLYEIIDGENKDELVIVCIGSDRSTGDSLGPVVGSILDAQSLRYFSVYGTLKQPIHAVNLREELIKIKNRHPQPFIIAIDACLGKAANIGTITLADGPVLPGAAVKKSLPPVGNVHFTGIVNIGGMMEYTVLQNTRLSTVIQLAETIATAITKTDAILTRKLHNSSFHDYFLQQQSVK